MITKIIKTILGVKQSPCKYTLQGQSLRFNCLNKNFSLKSNLTITEAKKLFFRFLKEESYYGIFIYFFVKNYSKRREPISFTLDKFIEFNFIDPFIIIKRVLIENLESHPSLKNSILLQELIRVEKKWTKFISTVYKRRIKL